MARRSPVRVLRRVWGLRRLDHDSGTGQAIAAAVRRSRGQRWTAEERAWIARIETRRGVLDASTERLPRGDGESEVLGEVSQVSSKSPHLAALLFATLRETGARSALELGTCVGISGAYEAAALRLNGGGSLVTIDGSAGRMQVAKDTFAELGLEEVDARLGEFGQALAELADEGRRFDYAFIDGNHREEPTIEYHRLFTDHLAAAGAIAVFDDIRWSDEMRRAWAAVARHPAVELAVDLGPLGLLVHGPGRTRQVGVPIS